VPNSEAGSGEKRQDGMNLTSLGAAPRLVSKESEASSVTRSYARWNIYCTSSKRRFIIVMNSRSGDSESVADEAETLRQSLKHEVVPTALFSVTHSAVCLPWQ
jgi:hypothetical protein